MSGDTLQQQVSASGDGMTETSQSLVDMVLSGDALRESVGGILCNDPSGLCLAARGSLSSKEDIDSSGIYTNLMRLALQLEGATTQQQQPQQRGRVGSSADSTASPLVTIEYDDSAILVKDYDGHTVAVRVPSAKAAAAFKANELVDTSESDSIQNGSSTDAS